MRLYAYYKPVALIGDMKMLIKSITAKVWAFALISVLLSVPLLGWRRKALTEVAVCYGLIWACSLLPPLWAYPATYLESDQLDMTLLLGLILVSMVPIAVLSVSARFSFFSARQDGAD